MLEKSSERKSFKELNKDFIERLNNISSQKLDTEDDDILDRCKRKYFNYFIYVASH